MSEHSILIIKNELGNYLNYYDERWNSYLFLNCKLDGNSNSDIQKQFITNRLNIKEENVEVKLIFDKIHTKYSESAKKNKEYHHYFYNVEIKELPESMTKKQFTLDNINYKWFSMDDLESDRRIQEVNSDIVSMIKEIRGD